MISSNPIYKLDTQGRLRSWRYEVDFGRWRSISGLVDGAQTPTEWTISTARSQPTAEKQAQFEADAEERKKLERQYHRTPEACATPNFFEPMLAKGYKPGQFPVANQPKLDGIRCIARAEGLFTRQGKPIVSCPHIEEELAPFFVADPDLVLDGELYNHALRADFEKISSFVRKQEPNPATAGVVQYHVYDIPSFDGTFFQRAPVYHAMLQGCTHLIPVETRISFNQDMLDADYAEYLENEWEGQMKRLDAAYEQKRSAHLQKRKEFQDAEFKIVEVVEGQGNWSGYAKRLTVQLPDGRTFGAGIAGNQDFCRKLLNDRTDWVGRQATIKFFTPTADGIPRFPVATKFHEGARM
ncbi:hypothetical protein NKK48_01745 [Mesorhizobium sp. C386A]|uniref:hypothetical protein n=1 Tax=unclassified Mesorhizobium TaxID=325217 RepID=UPI0003CEEC50|nr:hypothetical protein [Mesorhizobium sp. LNJC386A00]ESY35800.1 hypothetical protein X748_14435 [Mesorhizobium sp. LNJC386A00]